MENSFHWKFFFVTDDTGFCQLFFLLELAKFPQAISTLNGIFGAVTRSLNVVVH